jgi:hypothetical protein
MRRNLYLIKEPQGIHGNSGIQEGPRSRPFPEDLEKMKKEEAGYARIESF